MTDELETSLIDPDSEPDHRDPLGIIGQVIGGKYKVRSYIEGGGFGEVYEVFNTNLPELCLVIKSPFVCADTV